MMYISSSIRLVLPRLGLDFLPMKTSSVSFCPFQSFSNIVCVLGERVLILSVVFVALDGFIFCVGFYIDGHVFNFSLWVDVRFSYIFLGAFGAYDSIGHVNQNMAVDLSRNFGRHV